MSSSETAQKDGDYISEETVRIENRAGLHGRPTTMFVKRANDFESEVQVSGVEGGETVDGKSALGILSLGLEYGKVLRIRAEGVDAQEAVSALAKMVRNQFEEE